MEQPHGLETNDTEQLVMDAEAARYSSMTAGNADEFRTYCHPDLSYTHSDGSRDSLTSYLDKIRTGVYIYHHIDHPPDEVLIVDNTAVVVGQMNARITANGSEKNLANNSTAVWIREGGTWLLLAYQATPRPPA